MTTETTIPVFILGQPTGKPRLPDNCTEQCRHHGKRRVCLVRTHPLLWASATGKDLFCAGYRERKS